jgi:hypothetical protein
MKISAQAGNVKQKKRALPISREQEDALWNNGTFGTSNPKQSIYTLIYHLGIQCSLRAAKEHRYLVFGSNSQLQLKHEHEIEYIEYTERTSKNYKFGIKCSRMEPKTTRLYPNEENHGRCVVRLYKEYISHRPNDSEDLPFYLTPIPSNQVKSHVWYKKVAMGIHSIEQVTKNVMKSLEVEPDNFYSNTSLRRTAKCRLGISEKADGLYSQRVVRKRHDASSIRPMQQQDSD